MMAATFTAAAMTLGELLGPGASAHASVMVHDLVLDSREVRPGAAFIALEGSASHGLEFVGEARARGAAVVLYEPSTEFPAAPEPSVAVPGLRDRLGDLATTFFGRVHTPERVVGVTGTNGKTTVVWLVAQAASRLGPPCAYIGTLGFGIPPATTAHALTTPDCLTLHREIAALATASVALEVSSHALAQNRIAGLAIDTAVFTNLTRDHLDAHGSIEEYGRTKAKLFERPSLETAVLNLDDPYSARLIATLAADVEAVTVSCADGAATLVGHVAARGLAGLEMTVSGRFGHAAFRSPLIGDFNAENLMLALGALVSFDVPLERACAALSASAAAPGRMEVFGGRGGRPWVIVDYAHTPDALERTLAELERMLAGLERTRGRLGAPEVFCVFGCGGDRDPGKREPMGRIAARHADHLYLTDDNPRGEDPAAIVAAIARGTAGHASVQIVHEREAAIHRAIAEAAADDVVLIAGKGHETVQLVGTERRPFDDRAVVRAALGDSS